MRRAFSAPVMVVIVVAVVIGTAAVVMTHAAAPPTTIAFPDPSRADRAADRGTDRSAPSTATQPAPTASTEPTETAQTQPTGGGSVSSTGSCRASFYDEPQHTANGEVFDPDAFTAAHKSLPFNSRVRVTNLANGKSVVVRINIAGPLSPGAAWTFPGPPSARSPAPRDRSA